MSASLASSTLSGGGPEGSSGMDVMLIRWGEVGGEREPRRELKEADRECLLRPEEDGGDLDENENSGEGEENDDMGETLAEDEVLELGLLAELELESTDNRRRTLVC